MDLPSSARIVIVGLLTLLYWRSVVPLQILLIATAIGLYSLARTGLSDLWHERKIGTELFVTIAPREHIRSSRECVAALRDAARHTRIRREGLAALDASVAADSAAGATQQAIRATRAGRRTPPGSVATGSANHGAAGSAPPPLGRTPPQQR